MANIEINELPPAVSLDGTELIAIDKNTGPGYVTQKTSINSLSSLGVTQPYVVAQVTVGLPNSRRLTGAAGQINVIDGGPGADLSIGLATNGVVAGTYGDGTHVARVTIDGTGRVTSASQVTITNQGDVIGPASSVAGDIPVFSNATGKLLSDSGKALPAGSVVGTTDTQTLTNKSIDAGQLTGTVVYARLPVGTGANTVAAGDDSRIVNALNKNNNLSDVTSPSTTRGNISAAASGANGDITSLTGLTTALSVSQGGTGTTTSTGTGSVVRSISPALTGTPTVSTAVVDTNTMQAASTAFVLGQASAATPAMDGTAAVGTSTRYARADHVHPSDTSRLSLAGGTMAGNIDMGTINKITSLAAGTTATDAVNKGQMDAAITAATTIDVKWRSRFIGEVVYANTGVSGAEIPPSTTTDTVWIELTSGLTGPGGFNENKLTSENVSGSAPLVLASAVISYSASPMNGQTIRLINTEQRILRPSTSPGTLQNDQFQGFRLGASGGASLTLALLQITGGSTPAPFTTGSDYFSPVSDGTNGIPRTGTETRPKNIGVKAYMRIA